MPTSCEVLPGPPNTGQWDWVWVMSGRPGLGRLRQSQAALQLYQFRMFDERSNLVPLKSKASVKNQTVGLCEKCE